MNALQNLAVPLKKIWKNLEKSPIDSFPYVIDNHVIRLGMYYTGQPPEKE